MTQGEFWNHRRAAQSLLLEDSSPYLTFRPIWQQINVPPSTFVLFWGPWLLLPTPVAMVVHFFAHYTSFLLAVVLLCRWYLPHLRLMEMFLVVLLVLALFAPWRESIWRWTSGELTLLFPLLKRA